jgi:hypothetical protein
MKARPVFVANVFRADFVPMAVPLIPILSNALPEFSCILKPRDAISDKGPTLLPDPTWSRIRYKVRLFHPNPHQIRYSQTFYQN